MSDARGSGPITLSVRTTGVPERVPAIDVARGFAILAVVLHHVSGMSFGLLPLGSPPGEVLLVVNRATQWVVPAFLFVTAFVLTRSALRHFELRRYFRDRVRTALVPYLVWTVLFVLFRVLVDQDQPDVLIAVDRWVFWLQYGKGYYHLYFLLIVLQFYLLLPFLLPAWRRAVPLAAVVAAAFALQCLVYFLNREVLHLRFPGSVVLWYILPLTLGMYFGASGERFRNYWKAYGGWTMVLAAIAAAWYVPLASAVLRGQPVSTAEYSVANWVYTTTMTLVVVGVAHVAAGASARYWRPVERLGRVSLQVYLLHPALLVFFRWWGVPQHPALLVACLFGFFALGVLVPVVVAIFLDRLGWSRWLFGR